MTALIVIAFISCIDLGKSQYYMKITGSVDITSIHMPDTVNVNGTAPIALRAEAYESCWSDLRFSLTKNTDFEYSVQAYGTYESYGNCTNAVVTGDSTLSFKPTKAGLYKFSFLKDSQSTEIDTLIVK